MWKRIGNREEQSPAVNYDRILNGKPERGAWLEPGWRATTKGGAVLLALCLTVNLSILIWASVRPEPEGAPIADENNPVLLDGSCDQVNSIKTWSHLAINVVSTLILTTSTVCMQCLSAPTRDEVDEAHRKGRWLDVGILSTRNLPHINRKRIALYIVLGISSIPLHLFYNSVIFTTLGTYDSMTFLTTKDFVTTNALNATHLQYLTNHVDTLVPYAPWYYRPVDFDGTFVGSDPWKNGVIRAPSERPNDDTIAEVLQSLIPVNNKKLIHKSDPQDCLSDFSATPLTKYQNIAIVTSIASNLNGTILDLDFTLAPGRGHWTCSEAGWTYNTTYDMFFVRCILDGSPGHDRTIVAESTTGPGPPGSWNIDSCYYEAVEPRCTIVFAKSLMLVVVLANILKLAAMIYTIQYMDFQPCITVGDMVASFLQRPDIHTVGINPQSNLGIKEAHRYEVSRIYSLEHPGLKSLIGPKADHHEQLMHQKSWEHRQLRWRHAASTRRWSVTMGLYVMHQKCQIERLTFHSWGLALVLGAMFIGLGAGNNFNAAWSVGLGQAVPDFVIPDVSPTGQALLAQTVLANLPQIFLSTLYVFYSGLLTTMLSARELAAFATGAKSLRVSPPKVGMQRSSYFLQVPYRFAIPTIAVITLLHWLISQSVFLVRLDEYDVLGKLKAASFESVLGYSLRGTLGALVVGIAMAFFPLTLGLIKLPTGIPLMSHNSVAISVACHPFKDEPENACERPLRYGRITGIDDNGQKRSRIGFSAGENVENLQGGEEFEDTRCLSTFLFIEHGLEHSCTLDRNSFHLFLKVMKGGVKVD